MKLLGVIRDKNYLEYLDNGLDGLILPLEKFSVDYFKYYSIDDIKEHKKSTDKLCFVVINKMIFNNELEDLLNVLKELETLKVDSSYFIYASYGFGNIDNTRYKINSLSELINVVNKIINENNL